MFFTRERERGRFNQKPEGSVSFKGCNEVRLSISQTPFSRRCLRFSFFQEFFQEFFPASRAPLTELNFSWREPDPRSQTWNSNVRLFVSRGRTARFVGRVLQSCVCFENINTILVLEFLSLSHCKTLYFMQDSRIVSCWGDIFFLPAVSKNTVDKGNIRSTALNYRAYKCFQRKRARMIATWSKVRRKFVVFASFHCWICWYFAVIFLLSIKVFNNILYIFLFPNIKIRKTQKKVLNLVSTFLTISNNFVSTFDFYKFVIRYEKDFYPITRDKINIRFACKCDEKKYQREWLARIYKGWFGREADKETNLTQRSSSRKWPRKPITDRPIDLFRLVYFLSAFHRLFQNPFFLHLSSFLFRGICLLKTQPHE